MAAVLRGITWGHSRGITPLLAASQRYEELNPGVHIQWKKRTLQEFADFPIEKLTMEYDLLIIDHPWVGCAATTKCVLPLDKYLAVDYLQEQKENSVGGSHLSYKYKNSQWALAIDAATPAASYRKDLLDQYKIKVPQTWPEVIELAKKGKVAVPAIPIDLLMSFYSFCIAHGKEPFSEDHEVIDEKTGVSAINTMKEFYSLVDKRMFGCNPIAIAEMMTAADDFWYCPFAYGYSNYSRVGYADNLLHYTLPVSFNGKLLRTTVGGTGLAISASCKNLPIALDFTKWVVSAGVQRTLYVQHGGQPGHRSAWMDKSANQLTNNFFANILPAMDDGYIRPRYDGYLHFQDFAGAPLHQCLMRDEDPIKTLNRMNSIYRESLVYKGSTVDV